MLERKCYSLYCNIFTKVSQKSYLHAELVIYIVIYAYNLKTLWSDLTNIDIKKNLIQPILLCKLHSKVIENPFNTTADFVKIQKFYPSKGEWV